MDAATYRHAGQRPRPSYPGRLVAARGLLCPTWCSSTPATSAPYVPAGWGWKKPSTCAWVPSIHSTGGYLASGPQKSSPMFGSRDSMIIGLRIPRTDIPPLGPRFKPVARDRAMVHHLENSRCGGFQNTIRFVMNAERPHLPHKEAWGALPSTEGICGCTDAKEAGASRATAAPS